MTAFVHGHVQGVGFRWWTRARALELGLTGHATNLRDGRVQVVAEGPDNKVAQLLSLLRDPHPTRPGNVTTVVELYQPVRDEVGFVER